MTERKFTVVGIGEILWDVFPDIKRLGGAPANFAFHCSQLGEHALIVSRIGADDLGAEICEALKRERLDIEYLQVDTEKPTGTVKVELNQEGSPTYTIVTPVAWDAIECNDALLDLASRTDAVCFGSLSQRSRPTQETIMAFVRHMPKDALRVMDVNLRQGFYKEKTLCSSLALANVVKVSIHEMFRVCHILGIEGGPASTKEKVARKLMDTFKIELLCATKGKGGCEIYSSDMSVIHIGFPVDVVDTVGAGDASTAALVYHLLRGSGIERIAQAVNRMGSYVAAAPGATPRLTPQQIAEVTAI